MLYYGRCVDGRILTATCALASAQSTATQHTMRDLDRLLGYLSAHRHGTKIFRPSSMRLMLMSDASYLSRPNAGSVGGDFHHLGRTHDPTFINGPLSVSSTRIPIVCSSVQEAELAGTFGAAKIATVERQTLADLGYPQPPTIIHCDNEVAVGIANRTVKPKLSKSCDMRLHWLQDRVAQLQFLVRHIPGLLNIADYFTKTLPLSRHHFFAPFIAVDDPASARPQRLDLPIVI
jgi:hypothetical protein